MSMSRGRSASVDLSVVGFVGRSVGRSVCLSVSLSPDSTGKFSTVLSCEVEYST